MYFGSVGASEKKYHPKIKLVIEKIIFFGHEEIFTGTKIVSLDAILYALSTGSGVLC